MSNTDAKIQALKEIAIAHIYASTTPGISPSTRCENEQQAKYITHQLEKMGDITTTKVVERPQELETPRSILEIARQFPDTTGRIHQYDALACVNQIMSLEKQLADVKAELAGSYLGAKKASEQLGKPKYKDCPHCGITVEF